MTDFYTDAQVGGKNIRKGMIEIGLEGDSEKSRDFYNEISEFYDEYVESVGKEIGGLNLAKDIENEHPDKKARILDVGSGNGLLGIKLKELGYTEIDALDFAQRMLDLCKSKGVYKNYICASIQPGENTEIADNTYDIVCMNGCMGPGLVSPESLSELTRIAKPGGTVAFNITNYWVKNIPEFKEEVIEAKLQSFVNDGTWTKWTKKIRTYYSVSGETSVAYIATLA